MADFFISLGQYGDLGLLLLRLCIAAIFLVHGPKKLSGAMGGFMTFIGICETAGALAILAGFLTQLAVLGIAIIMIGATWKKINEWHIPFTTMQNTGWEFDLLILGTCLALLFLGAGAYSVDAMYWGM